MRDLVLNNQDGITYISQASCYPVGPEAHEFHHQAGPQAYLPSLRDHDGSEDSTGIEMTC